MCHLQPKTFGDELKQRMEAKGMTRGTLGQAVAELLREPHPGRGNIDNWFRRNSIQRRILEAIRQILSWDEAPEAIALKYGLTLRDGCARARNEAAPPLSRVLRAFDELSSRSRISAGDGDLCPLFRLMTHRDYFFLLTDTVTPLEHRCDGFRDLAVAVADAIRRGVKVVYFFPNKNATDENRYVEGWDEATSNEQFVRDFERFRQFTREHLLARGLTSELTHRLVYRYLDYYEYEKCRIVRPCETLGVFGTAHLNAARNARVSIRTPTDNGRRCILNFQPFYLMQERVITFARRQIVQQLGRLREQVAELEIQHDGDYQPPMLDPMLLRLQLTEDLNEMLHASETYLDWLESEDFQI